MSALILALLLSVPAPARAANERSEDALRESVLRLAAGDVAGAEAQARAAVAADPKSARALQQLARSANAALDFAGAEDAATRALSVDPPTPAILCLRSEARSGRGDYQGALDDAQVAGRMNPASGTAALRAAVAKEGLRRSPEEILSDYDRAAQLDASLTPLRDAARSRLAPPGRPKRGVGGLIGLLSFAALAGWGWGWNARRGEDASPRSSPPARPRVALPGPARQSPREALKSLNKAAESAPDAESAYALAEALYLRLTGRPPFPPDDEMVARQQGRFTAPSTAAPGLPLGLDAFFARALAGDPERRFRSGAELVGAYRSVVDPAID